MTLTGPISYPQSEFLSPVSFRVFRRHKGPKPLLAAHRACTESACLFPGQKLRTSGRQTRQQRHCSRPRSTWSGLRFHTGHRSLSCCYLRNRSARTQGNTRRLGRSGCRARSQLETKSAPRAPSEAEGLSKAEMVSFPKVCFTVEVAQKANRIFANLGPTKF